MDLSSAFQQRFRVHRPLREAAGVRAFLAEDRTLGREVLLKVCAEEVSTEPAPGHPAIARVLDAGQDVDASGVTWWWLALEPAAGRELAELLDEERQLPVEKAVAIVLAALPALAHVHAQGAVYRRVQPSSVLVLEDGTAMLSEFGLPASADYAAPEAVRGEALAATADIYALGCTFFESVAGRPPFLAGSEAELLEHHLHSEPPALERLNPEVSPQLAAVIARCLRKAPGERWQSTVELAAALEAAWVETTQTRAARRSERSPSRPGSQPRSPTLAARPSGTPASRPNATLAARPALSGRPGSRGKPSTRERWQRRRRRAFVLAALASGALIAAWGIWSRAARIERPLITFHAGGPIELSWHTLRPLAGLLEVVPLGGSDGREQRISESQPVREHVLEVGGLEPGRDYAVVVRSAGHEWSSAINVPSRPMLELSPGARASSRIVFPDPGWKHTSCVLVLAGDPAHPLAPRREDERWVFDVPRPPGSLEAGTYAEVVEAQGRTVRHRLRTAGELGAHLATAMERFNPGPLVQRIVDAPQYEARSFRQSMAYVFGASLGVQDRAESRKPREPGFFKNMVLAELRKLPWFLDLEAFRPLAPAFFSATTPLAHRRRLHAQLTRLEYLDILLRGQGELEPLGIRALPAGFVDVSHALVPRKGAPRDEVQPVPLLASPSAWFTAGYDQQAALSFWVTTHDFFPTLFPEESYKDIPALVKKHFAHQRTGPPVTVPAGTTAHVRLRVALLAADHFFEVRFRHAGERKPDDENDLLLLATHPGTPDWDDISINAQTTRVSAGTRVPGAAGGPEAAGPSVVRWGQIDIRFPAGLLPRPPFRAEVTYKSPPGTSSKKISGQLPTAYVGSATISVR